MEIRFHPPHKIEYDGKKIKDCTKDELIQALSTAIQEILDLKEIIQKQTNVLNFTLEMWRSQSASRK